MPEISIYQTESGVIEVHLDQDTVWVTQAQMSAVLGVQKAAISKHLKNIFFNGELERTATVSKMETVQREGKRSVKRRIEYFNLDALISNGYRINSVRATHFRQGNHHPPDHEHAGPGRCVMTALSTLPQISGTAQRTTDENP